MPRGKFNKYDSDHGTRVCQECQSEDNTGDDEDGYAVLDSLKQGKGKTRKLMASRAC